VATELLKKLLRLLSIDELIETSSLPVLLSWISFGKHRAQLWSAVPKDYIAWLLRQACQRRLHREALGGKTTTWFSLKLRRPSELLALRMVARCFRLGNLHHFWDTERLARLGVRLKSANERR